MVTEEPHGLNWINNVNPTTLGTIVTQICWLTGSLSFTWMGCVLLWRESDMAMLLVGSLLTAWGVKTGAGVVDAQQKRKANPAYAEIVRAETESKLAGAAATAVIEEKKAVIEEKKLDAASARARTSGLHAEIKE